MTGFHPHCRFKTDLVRTRAAFLCEMAQDLMYAMADWCQESALPFMVTDTVSTEEEDKTLNRVSATHREARAFDVSIRAWSESAVSSFESHFEEQYGMHGAIGFKSLAKELILRHECGHGDHLHVQLNRSFAVLQPLDAALKARG